MAHVPTGEMKSVPQPNKSGNKYLDEETLHRYAAERGRILSRVAEKPEVRVVYVTEQKLHCFTPE
ncbi:MAG TPA: hypothetical protein VEX68_01740 [Bryobacteraceae bacterium]|nr:hypothetical protein [Bryobacteraceae bacterium]